MRQTTILTLFVAVVMSVALFFLKFEVTELERELDILNKSIIVDRGAVRVLNAEWSHLNNSERLRELAERYLRMKPTRPDQIITPRELGPKAPAEAPNERTAGKAPGFGATKTSLGVGAR